MWTADDFVDDQLELGGLQALARPCPSTKVGTIPTVPRPDIIQCRHPPPPHKQNKPYDSSPSSSSPSSLSKGVANTCRQLPLSTCRQGPTLKSFLLMALTMVVVVPGALALQGTVRDEVWKRWVPRQRRELINDETQRYLMRYGYLPMSDMETGNLRTEDQLREALRTLQHFGHIPVTGRLDEATKALMKRPRCSLPDVLPGKTFQTQGRVKRFVKQGSRWDRYNITWGIRTYPTQIRERTGRPDHLTRWEIQREIRLATEVWGRASRLVFLELETSPEKADIIIDFKTGYHGDGYPFDGQGRTLAHAFYPGHGIGGDMHFDDEELWVQHKDSTSTWDHVSLFITAAHELGHALGLYHSDVEGALMSPYLIKFPSSFHLPEDDVRGIQELYGVDENWKGNAPPTQPPKPTEPPPTKSPTKKPVLPPKNTGKPDTCDTEYDAISVIRREVYIFKGKYFWRLNSAGVLRPNYPAEINRFWTMLPKNITHIDAVYERPHDSNIVFFVGDRYYVCQGNHLLLENKPLRELGLPDDLKKIDAAFVWGHNGRTYFFAESMYWRFDETVQNVELDYPRDMVMWSGVPYNIDSAFKFNGTTYFFKGKIFWEFDDLRMKVKPKSPALSAPFWFGCPNTKNQFLLGAPVSESAASLATTVSLSGAPLTVLTLRITALLLSSLRL